MVQFRYTGKQPILVGHKFIYQDEVHNVTAAQWATLQAQYNSARFVLLTAPITKELLSADNNNETQGAGALSAPVQDLNNQTEKKPRKRGKAG